jgi:NAD dependent epimerase/dehydratase family enzyme
VDDVSGLIRYAIDHRALRGPLNVTAPAPVRQREFAKTLGRVLRRPAWVPAPALALKLVLGEFSTEVLTSKRVVPEAAEQAGYLFAHTQLEPALRDILAD